MSSRDAAGNSLSIYVDSSVSQAGDGLSIMNGEIKHLYVTLKRSFAGTRESHVDILKSLGLRKREQTVQKANTAAARGAIDKVIPKLCLLGDW